MHPAAGGVSVSRTRAPHAGRRTRPGASGHDAVDLEALGVLAVHVDAVDAGEVPDVLGIGVAAVLLRGVARERGDLALEVRASRATTYAPYEKSKLFQGTS